MEVRFTSEADRDLQRLYDFLLMRGFEGAQQAESALIALRKGLEYIASSPWGCRRVTGLSAEFRELVVSWGNAGYVLIYEIEPNNSLTVLAVRHQQEDRWM